ncbi:imidazole glycerol phosphate synthase subunit HisH [Sporomusa acidovorans]|uniref:Imidazole glycerol phosphate synthase subunit HisH n=1 Tax=Sporomusa acidovorans (strain ATCC 49682 / DSM 3132 / Mol) TaxID=1123286 RepID=A0ABZ3J4K3_SPOA4|nr:imidazole glycerol phosphate synthase subunit HisH [Sporomusa acidovorans]OZC23920.1 imidazole glycerol phosphate synthase subunit HisH 1 [Sporomusa acidovorans DSM 3132]SDF31121.1 glutamine amidotransferase [Sporomusa acidovorans]
MARETLAIIDYGMGNLHSVSKALAKLNAETAGNYDIVVTSDPAVIGNAAKVVLPGVGAFGDCMANLENYGLVPIIKEVAGQGTPFLGICLGLQLLFDGSEEDPGIQGLGILSGMVRKIIAPELKIPHMGWNSLEFKTPSLLFGGLPAAPYVYFVHSYHAVPDKPEVITAVTEYGSAVTAAVGCGNVQAVQFHPEKSSAAGLAILANFLRS